MKRAARLLQIVSCVACVGAWVNFQVAVLKVLASYPDGFAPMTDLKRDLALLATSGRDWAERTRRLAARVPGLDIFSQGLVERLDGGWRLAEKGRAVLETMEQDCRNPRPVAEPVPVENNLVVAFPAERDRRHVERRRRSRKARQRARAQSSDAASRLA